MSAACQQVNQLLAGLPPHSFDLKQVSGGSQIHSPLDKGHRGRHDGCTVCGNREQTERLGVWGSRLGIGAGITREGGYEASTNRISYCHLAGVKSRVQLKEGGISLSWIRTLTSNSHF